jgi:hypothetical protein
MYYHSILFVHHYLVAFIVVHRHLSSVVFIMFIIIISILHCIIRSHLALDQVLRYPLPAGALARVTLVLLVVSGHGLAQRLGGDAERRVRGPGAAFPRAGPPEVSCGRANDSSESAHARGPTLSNDANIGQIFGWA